MQLLALLGRFCGAQEDEAVLMTPCCCIGRHQHAAHLKCLVRPVWSHCLTACTLCSRIARTNT
eukprot:6455487-Amphidinium_carterae.1